MISDDLNVVNIVKQLKRVKFMFYTLLSNHKRFMFYYQRDMLIDPTKLFKKDDNIIDKLSSDDNSDFDYGDVCEEVRNYKK